MNRNEIEKIWSILRSKEELRNIDAATAQAFDRRLDSNPDLLAEVADEQIVDALLRFEAFRETKKDNFVQQCVKAIQSDIAAGGGDVITEDDLVEIATGDISGAAMPGTAVSTGSPRSTGIADSIDNAVSGTAPVARLTEVDVNQVLEGTAPVLPKQNGSYRSRWTFAVATVASAAAVLLIVAGVSGWFGSPDVNNNISDNRNDSLEEAGNSQTPELPIASDEDPAIDSPDLDSPGAGVESTVPESIANLDENDRVPVSPEVPDTSNEQIAGQIPDAVPPVRQPAVNGESIADNETQVQPVEQPDGSYETESFETYATIRDLGELNGADGSGVGRIGDNLVEFTSGRGAIEFDNGAIIKFLAPAAVRIVDGDSIEFLAGNYQTEVPREVDHFELLTPGNRWVCSGRTNAQVHFHPAGTIEGYVFRGDLTLMPQHEAVTSPGNPATVPDDLLAENIELEDRGLNQILIYPKKEPGIPSITMAMGDRQQFLGQIGVDGRSWRTSSPDHFIQAANTVLNSGAEEGADTPRPNEGLERWQSMMQQFENQLPGSSQQVADLNNLMNQIMNGQNGAGQSNGSSMFDGMIDINGNQRRFNNQQEFDQARQQADLPLQANEAPFGNDRQFDGMININGNAFRFTTPAEFKNFQRMMRN